jgi:hypothetical protein
MPTDTRPNLMVGLMVKLLGAELAAGVLDDDKGRRIFVDQDVKAANDGMTIADLIADMKRLTGKKDGEAIEGLDEDTIKGTLKSVCKTDDTRNPFKPETIRIKLQTVYLNIFTPKTGASTVDYALRVEVTADGLLPPEVQLLQIHGLTFSIWNTKKPDLVKRLSLPSIGS